MQKCGCVAYNDWVMQVLGLVLLDERIVISNMHG